MAQAQATLHGAISIVNAVATGKGATLGVSLKTSALLEASPGNGVFIESRNKAISSRLINKVIQKVIPKNDLENTKIQISLQSEIPTGYGLKSSSAISSAVALACAKLFRPKWNDSQILLAGVDASIESKVSITGAYDDACGCYYGGFAVTENYKRKIVNGMATSTILNSDPKLISDLIENGALGASVSGNGPAIAAISKKENIANIKKVFSNLAGTTIVSEINNKKAEVYEL